MGATFRAIRGPAERRTRWVLDPAACELRCVKAFAPARWSCAGSAGRFRVRSISRAKSPRLLVALGLRGSYGRGRGNEGTVSTMGRLARRGARTGSLLPIFEYAKVGVGMRVQQDGTDRRPVPSRRHDRAHAYSAASVFRASPSSSMACTSIASMCATVWSPSSRSLFLRTRQYVWGGVPAFRQHRHRVHDGKVPDLCAALPWRRPKKAMSVTYVRSERIQSSLFCGSRNAGSRVRLAVQYPL